MKKILALILIVCALFTLVSCGKEKYELAIGVAVGDPTGGSTVSETVAAVIFDEDGKIVACRIDTVDVDVSINAEGTVAQKAYKTKAELGYDYKMAEYANTSEWFEQARAFESFVVGKTAAEVSGINPSDKELVAGCTIDMTDFVKAVVAAGADEHKVAFEAKDVPTLGVSAVAAATDAASEENVEAQVTVDFAAVAMVNGEVVAATLDCADATLTLALGDAVEPEEPSYECTDFAFKGTKRVQGYGYGMAEYAKTSEWFEQAQAYANATLGMNASEVAALPTTGVAGCTIYAGSMQQALDKAAQYVR